MSSFIALANQHLRNGHAGPAEQVLREGLASDARVFEGWCILADLLTRRHAYEDALEANQRALALLPDDPRGLISRGRTLRALNRREEAVELFNRALARPPLPLPLQAHGFMELGRTLDELSRPIEAWQAITLGQQIRRRLGVAAGLNNGWLSEHLDALNEWLRVRHHTSPIPWDDPRPRPVFLVGIPRSGTTLMEQILVAAGCESTAERPALTAALADVMEANPHRGYPGSLEQWPVDLVRAIRARFFEYAGYGDSVAVLHKLPLDLLHLGLIDRVFDGAPVVLAFRDPRDTLLSGYFQNLVLNPAMFHWTEPESLARATRGLLQLARRYAQSLTGLNLRVQHYARLTEDPSTEMRALVEHAQRPWTEHVAQFHETARHRSIATPSSHAVTEPVHRRARARWQIYERQLAPVLPLLDGCLTFTVRST
ncbi:MAG: sulfotransferase [Myxococcota bacterium]